MNALILTTLLLPALASDTEATPAVPAEAELETPPHTDAPSAVQLFEIDAPCAQGLTLGVTNGDEQAATARGKIDNFTAEWQVVGTHATSPRAFSSGWAT